MRGTLIIFVKAPVAGRVKTRLALALGPGRAAATFRRLTGLTISHASKGDWRTLIAVDPPQAISRYAALWPRRFSRLVQARGDLGSRMRAAFDGVACPCVIIGSDAPALRARHIRAAFSALAGHDAVVGPATDGGFWLIGLANRRRAARLFEGVRWSSEHALADTLASLPGAFSVARLETLRDVDEPLDLEALGWGALRISLARS